MQWWLHSNNELSFEVAIRIAKYFNGNRKFYCDFWLAGEQCRYDLIAILIAPKLHNPREIKQAVEKELTYLFSPRMKPVLITKNIDYNTLEKFIELIHNIPYLSKLGSFDVLPEELARPCNRRYLSHEHMSQSDYS